MNPTPTPPEATPTLPAEPQLYPDVDAESLGVFFFQHLEGMTREKLHGKADIAAQLAWRDHRIHALERVVDAEVTQPAKGMNARRAERQKAIFGGPVSPADSSGLLSEIEFLAGLALSNERSVKPLTVYQHCDVALATKALALVDLVRKGRFTTKAKGTL